jgi:cytochrome c oxidase subunit 3
MHGVCCRYYVALMTFILIFSSVTMVLAVAGHQMKKDKVVLYMFLTIMVEGYL